MAEGKKGFPETILIPVDLIGVFEGCDTKDIGVIFNQFLSHVFKGQPVDPMNKEDAIIFSRLMEGYYAVNPKTCVYLVELFDYNDHFLKVGISVDVQKRLKAYKREGFSSKLWYVDKFDTPKIAKDLESHILNHFSKHKFWPSRVFGGYTECLNLNSRDIVIEELAKH